MVKTSLPDSKACIYTFITGSPSYKVSGLSVRVKPSYEECHSYSEPVLNSDIRRHPTHEVLECNHLLNGPLLPHAQTSCMVPCYHVHRLL